jgi:hypothetical protein
MKDLLVPSTPIPNSNRFGLEAAYPNLFPHLHLAVRSANSRKGRAISSPITKILRRDVGMLSNSPRDLRMLESELGARISFKKAVLHQQNGRKVGYTLICLQF